MDARSTRILGSADVADAARILREGGTVVFPTETVYGLGARADRVESVEAIFRAKGRPADNPLIVHVADAAAISDAIAEVGEVARVLFERFSPGPLTVILPRGAAVPDAVTAGLDTVGLRIPDHPVARALLAAAGVPVAAPSANRSGRPSPTDLQSAREHMEGRVDAILDGGACARGLESTVVRVSGEGVEVLREGAISREEIAAVVATADPRGDFARAAPGTRHPHYRPKAQLRVHDRDALDALISGLGQDERALILGGTSVDDPRIVVLESVGVYAREFYRLLHRFDREGVKVIHCERPPEAGIGRALRDRLRRAAGGI